MKTYIKISKTSARHSKYTQWHCNASGVRKGISVVIMDDHP